MGYQGTTDNKCTKLEGAQVYIKSDEISQSDGIFVLDGSLSFEAIVVLGANKTND